MLIIKALYDDLFRWNRDRILGEMKLACNAESQSPIAKPFLIVKAISLSIFSRCFLMLSEMGEGGEGGE